MIFVGAFSGKTVAVMGLGKSGLSAAEALEASGATVWAWDDSVQNRKSAEAKGLELTNLYLEDWTGVEILVLSPGIPDLLPKPHRIAEKAHKRGCEIVCDVDLLARAKEKSQFIGITGSNGKSTTTSLIGHILYESGREVAVGGNIGKPALRLDSLGEAGIYVLELSSYQLERVPSLKLNIAIILNISPDHLDRHGGMDGYVAAKKSIISRIVPNGKVVIGMDDQVCRGISLDIMMSSKLSSRNIIPVSANGRMPGGVYIDGTDMVNDIENDQVPIIDMVSLRNLPGRHNWQNAAAACAVASMVGIEKAAIAKALTTFAGLPHRQEVIRIIGDVRYINDSKATNTRAAAKALGFYKNIFWIAGGKFKEGSLDILSEELVNVRHAYLIGDAEDTFAQGLNGKVPITRSGDLKTAVHLASEAARALGAHANVLLSPACASFDQFANYEARGKAFRKLVEDLR